MKYNQFKVYKDSKDLVVRIFRLTRKFDREYFYLSDQINRSALSIILNIAEGSAKSSNKDFNRYILNALGSATELSAALEIARDLRLVDEKIFNETNSCLLEIIKQLGGFSKFLKENIKKL